MRLVEGIQINSNIGKLENKLIEESESYRPSTVTTCCAKTNVIFGCEKTSCTDLSDVQESTHRTSKVPIEQVRTCASTYSKLDAFNKEVGVYTHLLLIYSVMYKVSTRI